MSQIISVEAGEFTGKTSVVLPVVSIFLEQCGYSVVCSREPGGTPEAESIRAEIFAAMEAGVSSYELAKMFYRARKLHIDQVIIPALKDESIVILDRYADSTRVYQYLGGEVTIEQLQDLERETLHNVDRHLYPDLTLLLHLGNDAEEFADHMRARQAYVAQHSTQRDDNAFDRQELSRHHQRQLHVLQLPELSRELGDPPRRFVPVDAARHPLQVATEVTSGLAAYFQIPEEQAIEVVKYVEQSGLLEEVCSAYQWQQEYLREPSQIQLR